MPVLLLIMKDFFLQVFIQNMPKLTAIVCYSSTEDKMKEDKNYFYEELQKVLEETPVHYGLLILGDSNAKGGKKQGGERIHDGKTWL